MSKISMLFRSGLGLLGGLAASPAQAAWTLNMNKGVTGMTAEVFDLHMLIFWICVVIGVGVFVVMLYSVIMHRKSRGVEAAHFHESTLVEIAWTVVPFIILIVVAIPAAGTLLQLEDSSDPDMTIKVTGHQWLWEYEYVDSDVHFFSRLDKASERARHKNSGIDPRDVPHYLRNVDNPMVVPVDTRVRVLLTSGDVIHAWWVPELSGKKDAIPGYINDIWFKADETGTFRGQCAELCGRGHGYMPIVVKVVSSSDYDSWLAEQSGETDSDDSSDQAAGSDSAPDDQGDSAADTPSADTADGDSESDAGDTPNETASGDEEGGDASASDGQTQQSNGQEDDQNGATEEARSDDADKLSKAELMDAGKKVYGNICAACHQADGSGLEAAGFPSLQGSPAIKGPVAAHVTQILNGKNAMPPYKNTLDDKQIAAVVTYERNAFGNDSGDVIQPAQVAEQR